jgi:ABC-type transport system substrate-binding protein
MKNGDPLRATIGTNADDPVNVRLATLIQAQLASLGMRISIKPYPTNVWFSLSGPLRTGNLALMSESWIGGSDPEQSVNLLCREAVNGGDNHSRYCSRRLDALFADQARTQSDPLRNRDFDEMERLVYEDVPVVPLFNEIYFEGLSKRVTGYQKNMLRFPVNPELWDAK